MATTRHDSTAVITCTQPAYHAPTAPVPPAVWAAYLRLSKPKSKKGRRRNDHDTHERQLDDLRAFAAANGITISPEHVYRDTLSAWRKGAVRPGFEAMIAAAKRGEFAGILVWHISRFTRRTQDALDFITLYEVCQVKVDGPGSGDYDLSTADGRSMFRRAAEKSEHESDLISERVGSKLGKSIAAGLQMGGCRIFGFELLSEMRRREVIMDDDVLPVRREPEIAVIREAAARAVAGETWASITRDINARAAAWDAERSEPNPYRTTRGNPWQANKLAQMVSHPRNGGFITRGSHGREIIGVMPPEAGEPILDAGTYARVQAIMAKNAQAKPGRPLKGTYALSGYARCGKCDRVLNGSANRKGGAERRYLCPPSVGGCGSSISADDLEAAVRKEVLRKAASPANRAIVAEADRELDLAREELRQRLAAASRELDALDEELAALSVRARLKGPEGVRPREYEALRSTLLAMIGEKEAARDELTGKLDALPAPASGGELPPALTAEQWDAMTPAEQRTTAERFRVTVTLLPRFADGPHNRVDPRRIVVK